MNAPETIYGKVMHLPLDMVMPDPNNPRKDFDSELLEDLNLGEVESIEVVRGAAADHHQRRNHRTAPPDKLRLQQLALTHQVTRRL